MNESKIVVRYTKALFNLAQEKDLLSAVAEDFEMVKGIMDREEKIRIILYSPVLKTENKRKAIEALFSQNLNKLSYNFLLLILKKGREYYLEAFIRYFTSLYREHMGITHAVITTAVPQSAKMLAKIEEVMTGKDISRLELEQKTNPDILGGFILRIDDRQYDGSIATQLKKIKTTLIQTSVINN